MKMPTNKSKYMEQEEGRPCKIFESFSSEEVANVKQDEVYILKREALKWARDSFNHYHNLKEKKLRRRNKSLYGYDFCENINYKLIAVNFIIRKTEDLFPDGPRRFIEILLSYETRFPAVDANEIPIKAFSTGISLCSNEDTFNLKKGLRIALTKALETTRKMIVNDSQWFGLLNSQVAKAVLESDSSFFARCPEIYIEDFKNRSERWKKDGKVLEESQTEGSPDKPYLVYKEGKGYMEIDDDGALIDALY